MSRRMGFRSRGIELDSSSKGPPYNTQGVIIPALGVFLSQGGQCDQKMLVSCTKLRKGSCFNEKKIPFGIFSGDGNGAGR
jgi:hypothetical protein